MNARERLSRCYRHQETDRPGIYVRTGYPINDPTYEPLKQYLATHSDLKAIWDGRKIQYNLPVTTVDEAYNEDFVSRVFVLNTPGGSLRSVLRASRHGLPGMVVELYEKKPENIREQTEQLIQEVYDKKQGLIVCPTASPYIRGQGAVCYEQFKALTETVIRWR